MKNLDRFDDEVKKQDTPSNEELLKKKERTALIKRGIMFTAKLFLYHFVAMIIYGIALSSTVTRDVYEDLGAATTLLLIFSMAALLIFTVITSLELRQDGDRKRSFLALSQDIRGSVAVWAKLSLPDCLTYSVIYFVFQFPFAIFHHSFGFDALLTTGFEKYYIMDLGLMELTGIGFLGALLNCVIFFVLLMVLRFTCYSTWHKEKIVQ